MNSDVLVNIVVIITTFSNSHARSADDSAQWTFLRVSFAFSEVIF